MLEWCMTHPWMTFILAIIALDVIGTLINNVIKLVHNVIIMKCTVTPKKPDETL